MLSISYFSLVLFPLRVAKRYFNLTNCIGFILPQSPLYLAILLVVGYLAGWVSLSLTYRLTHIFLILFSCITLLLLLLTLLPICCILCAVVLCCCRPTSSPSPKLVTLSLPFPPCLLSKNFKSYLKKKKVLCNFKQKISIFKRFLKNKKLKWKKNETGDTKVFHGV